MAKTRGAATLPDFFAPMQPSDYTMHDLFSANLRAACSAAESITENVVLSNAERVDEECLWPADNLLALRKAGLTGLTAPTRVGGRGQGLLGLAAVTEIIARGCPSTAMCFGMHCVATAVIAAKATAYQDEHYLMPIAAGEHLSTLALSEAGTGSQFFLPHTRLTRDGAFFIVDGTKQFVTNGGRADSYVVSTQVSAESELGEFSCVVVDGELSGVRWGEPWRGLGMRGNASRAMELSGVRVPMDNLLGQEGEQVWYVFEVVAPFFLTAMAGTYLGVAHAALNATVQHLKSRHFEHSGITLSQLDTVQHRVGEMWMELEKTRLLVYRAAQLGDMGSADAMPSLLSCKAAAADTAVRITNEAMTLSGGIAYRENSALARALRDARASHVMAPTTDLLKIWTGRTVLGLPLL